MWFIALGLFRALGFKLLQGIYNINNTIRVLQGYNGLRFLGYGPEGFRIEGTGCSLLNCLFGVGEIFGLGFGF